MIDPLKVYFGGITDKVSRYIAPTLLQDITFEDACMQEEIFGPILPFISFDALDDILPKVKALSKPLSCYVFTSSSNTKKRLLHELSFGGGAINDAVMHITNPNLPFGGVGHSGMGNYHGEAGFKTFTHYKSVMDKPSWLELPLKYSPYSKLKLGLLKRLMKL
jgi:aldehyde dehydrogenase (NAD+)